MTAAILTSVSHARRAFLPLPEPEDRRVIEALKVLRSTEADDTGMGFHSLSRNILDVKRLLDEHGLVLDERQLEILINYCEAVEEQRRGRLRFLMQIVVSIAVLAGATALLALGDPSKANTESAFGLIGCVVGYWLR